MAELITPTNLTPDGLMRPASRRTWLKGMGALLGSGLLAAPAAVLAAPVPVTAAEAITQAGGDEYIGVVKLLAGTSLPIGWSLCDGRVLPVAEHPALFAVLGAA
ncbi:tail fiber protein, partial [Hymenobacter agri]